jgi:hypothetical protein
MASTSLKAKKKPSHFWLGFLRADLTQRVSIVTEF